MKRKIKLCADVEFLFRLLVFTQKKIAWTGTCTRVSGFSC
jgi:hypothetical protein